VGDDHKEAPTAAASRRALLSILTKQRRLQTAVPHPSPPQVPPKNSRTHRRAAAVGRRLGLLSLRICHRLVLVRELGGAPVGLDLAVELVGAGLGIAVCEGSFQGRGGGRWAGEVEVRDACLNESGSASGRSAAHDFKSVKPIQLDSVPCSPALQGAGAHLDGHAGAVEALGEQHALPAQPVVGGRELELAQGERVAQVQQAVHVGVGEVAEELSEVDGLACLQGGAVCCGGVWPWG